MPATLIARLAIVAAATLALLNGCAGISPEMPVQSAVEFSRALAAKPIEELPSFFVFSAQLYGNDIGVYRRKGLSLTYYETLLNGVSSPQGMVTTANGWIYVANSGHSNILIYREEKHGPKGPLKVLDDSGQIPVDVDVHTSRKLVAVSNSSTTYKGAGSVSIYLNRKVRPTRNLTYGIDSLAGMGVAIDRHGNCYWSFNDPASGSGSIVEFAGCEEPGSVVVPKVSVAGGIAFDQHDDMYYVDQTNGIYKCNGTSNCALFATGFGDPVNINFDHKHKNLWVADATGYIDAVNPKTGAIEYTVKAIGGPTDPPFGIAPEPGN